MKKILALILSVIMGLAVFTGCSDPLATDFENFLNVQMVEPNAKFDEVKAECGTWESFETDDQFVTSLKENLIPKCTEILDLLSKINPETEKVKAVKEKFVTVVELYKEGFEVMITAFETGDEAKINESDEKINEGIKVLDEYNKELESLAAELGMEIQY